MRGGSCRLAFSITTTTRGHGTVNVRLPKRLESAHIKRTAPFTTKPIFAASTCLMPNVYVATSPRTLFTSKFTPAQVARLLDSLAKSAPKVATNGSKMGSEIQIQYLDTKKPQPKTSPGCNHSHGHYVNKKQSKYRRRRLLHRPAEAHGDPQKQSARTKLSLCTHQRGNARCFSHGSFPNFTVIPTAASF